MQTLKMQGLKTLAVGTKEIASRLDIMRDLMDTKKRKGKKREDNADSGRGQDELPLGGRVLEITLLWKRNGERISGSQKQRLINSAMNCDHFCRRNVLACERHCM